MQRSKQTSKTCYYTDVLPREKNFEQRQILEKVCVYILKIVYVTLSQTNRCILETKKIKNKTMHQALSIPVSQTLRHRTSGTTDSHENV